ncbi:hypothetical protein CK203_098114 [Vitis vinifera]|uniref:Uncharacterized protein n=1 Tax=Vitis vinifera TaxID=29760 RepID=A0A438C676_VITVI|nr:hypothetical protein CK203_098114 [Vitis vinifera]
MEIPHEDQSSHYDHEKDKFTYLSMRDRIELGKRQVQQSQWGSKYALNEDMSMKAKLASMARRIEEFELRNVHTEAQPQAMPTSFEYINHPNLTTQPQPQPSMSTSSLEQAILKISKVMEDFVGEQQKINSHLNEKIDNLESSMNVRKEGVYNDLSLRIEKVQDSIEKLTNLDIARGKRKLPPQPPITFKKPMQKDQGKKRRETNSLGPNGKNANFVWDPGEFIMKYDACKNRSYDDQHRGSQKQGKTGEKSQNRAIRTTPFQKLLGTFRSLSEVHFMLLYLVSKLGKLGVHSRTPFSYYWTRVWSTFWSSNYAYHISFLKLRKSGVQCFKQCAIWI